MYKVLSSGYAINENKIHNELSYAMPMLKKRHTVKTPIPIHVYMIGVLCKRFTLNFAFRSIPRT